MSREVELRGVPECTVEAENGREDWCMEKKPRASRVPERRARGGEIASSKNDHRSISEPTCSSRTLSLLIKSIDYFLSPSTQADF